MVARSLSSKGLSNWTDLSVNVSFGLRTPAVVGWRDGVGGCDVPPVGRVVGSGGFTVRGVVAGTVRAAVLSCPPVPPGELAAWGDLACGPQATSRSPATVNGTQPLAAPKRIVSPRLA